MLEILEQLRSSKYLVKKCRLNKIKKENKSNTALMVLKVILTVDGKPKFWQLITNQTALMKLRELLLMEEEFFAKKTKKGKL